MMMMMRKMMMMTMKKKISSSLTHTIRVLWFWFRRLFRETLPAMTTDWRDVDEYTDVGQK